MHLRFICRIPAALTALAIAFGALTATAADFALAFDGTNDYVRVASAPALTISNRFTLEFWFKPATTNQSNAYLLAHNGLDPSAHAAVIYEFAVNAVEFYAIGYSGADPRTGSAMIINDTQWHHVAYSYNGTNWNGYLDGISMFALNRTFSLNTASNDWFIGSASPGLNHVAGTFDEVRVWNFGRSKDEIQGDMNRRLPQVKPGLVAYYKLDEGSGTATTDNSAHGFSGTLVNGPQWVASDAPIVPDVTTLAETGVSSAFATLHGSINPLGRPASAWLEWGLSTNYGNITAVTNVGNGSQDAEVVATVNAFVGGQPYYFRVVATNAYGRAYGAARSFTPAPAFTAVGAGLPLVGVYGGQWADFDNDGRVDVLLAGAFSLTPKVEIWRNTPGGFVNMNAGLTGANGAVAVADYDNDGRLDILLAGHSQSGEVSQVWRNTSNGFVNINAGLTGLVFTAVAWGDYDNDGRPDILLTGQNGADIFTQVWRNTTNGFLNINAGLPPVESGAVAWGDYDNDGRLDILLTGRNNSVLVSQVWRNTGGGFENINAGLPAVHHGAVAWGDYDNDGRLDILLTGDTGSGRIAQVWRNTPGGFVNINAGLPGVAVGDVAWGDYDNDGRLDILLSGLASGGDMLTQVWRNTSNGFVNINAGLPSLYYGSLSWGDYDNDGDLDILLTGYNGSETVCEIWRNNHPVTNTPPLTPGGLKVDTSGPWPVLRWNLASDSQTPVANLTYNLRWGTTPGGTDIISPAASNTGQRRLPAIGNMQFLTNRVFTPLSGTTYYWSVQAIDGTFAGSPFAPEQSFTLAMVFAPTNGVPVPGDLNGDGKVDEGELNQVLAHYWPYSPLLEMTNVAGLGGTNVTFALTNSVAGAFSVEYTTNFADWNFLGPATPRYLFTDTNAPSGPQRYYRLRWP